MELNSIIVRNAVRDTRKHRQWVSISLVKAYDVNGKTPCGHAPRSLAMTLAQGVPWPVSPRCCATIELPPTVQPCIMLVLVCSIG